MSSVDKVEHCSSAASDAVTETSIHHCSIFPIYCCTEVFLVKKLRLHLTYPKHEWDYREGDTSEAHPYELESEKNYRRSSGVMQVLFFSQRISRTNTFPHANDLLSTCEHRSTIIFKVLVRHCCTRSTRKLYGHQRSDRCLASMK